MEIKHGYTKDLTNPISMSEGQDCPSDLEWEYKGNIGDAPLKGNVLNIIRHKHTKPGKIGKKPEIPH